MAIPDINAWLVQHPDIAQHILWHTKIPLLPIARRLRWADWPAANKQKLVDCFADYWSWNDTIWEWYDAWADSEFAVLPDGYGPSPSTTLDADPSPVLDPPINIQLSAPGGSTWTVIDSVAAFDLYVRYVAMTLAVEIGEHVGWSMFDYDWKSLPELLDGSRMFRWIGKGNSPWGVINASGHRVITLAIPAPPMISTSFLALNGLIAPTRLETIERLLNWCRANLLHTFGGVIQSGKTGGEVFWQYHGDTPLSRVINGTVMTEPVGNTMDNEVHHWTAGCHGTSALLREVLRAINIPVRVVCHSHFMPYFMSEKLYLSHGDDPYALADEIPIAELPIDEATFVDWFINDPDPAQNVGRRVSELTIEYLPIELLQHYCWDLAANNSHVSGWVYNNHFAKHYTVAQLEAQQLWQKMDAKLTMLGGCANL
jgi:hypothetical protein